MSQQHRVVYRGPPMLGAVLIQMLEQEGLGVELEGTEAPHEHEAAAEQEEVLVRLSVVGDRPTVETVARRFSRDHPGIHVEVDDRAD